ncbi:vitamin K epoxide reductase family protein [Georgenia yuyongxinii]|uniref:Vitamin K epoxide reductase family protein n=1 Tax=Georgenia yuyongxinii TaxID=2589797 RepID=A0A552WP44_9MICO|nr:vitamin K epoxide reductase family protein [Georgenia yuyongxinii]TRW44477.1 vitamin K epoxide reductase family protein [Georgenia yuyongxinii]
MSIKHPGRAGADPAEDEDAGLEDAELEDAELERELRTLDRSRPTAHQRAGGAPPELGWVLTIGGALGLWAAVMLVLSEITVAADPDATLACDFNPLVGCGEFITTWQAHVLGPPNAVVGTAAFGAVLAVGLMLLAGARVARWFWLALTTGVSLGMIWVLWFQVQALFVIKGLCPYCLVVWTAMIPVFVHVWARSVQGGHVRAGERLRRALVLDRWLIVGAWYAVVVAAAVVVFWERWLLLF